MVKVPDKIFQQVVDTFGQFFQKIAHLPAEKIAMDVLNEEKVHDQIKLLCDTLNIDVTALKGKKILEVGSGLGIFLAVTRRDYHAKTYGLEPSGEGFTSSHSISKDVLRSYGIDSNIVLDAKGEQIPFEDNYFDIIFSSTVLEHTENPQKVITEAVRVLKPGGYLQFVFPNYGSFFEGHYAIFWIPYLNHRLAYFWIKLWGRNPEFMKTIQLLNYFKVKKWISKMNQVKVITFGEEIFRQRMLQLDIKDWAGLGKIKKWLQLVNKLKLIPLVTSLIIMIKSFEPIVLTLQKKVGR
ncbi:MAG: class I SAM-dependent methyltransferase [Candidatus Helarchaeota archaeon]